MSFFDRVKNGLNDTVDSVKNVAADFKQMLLDKQRQNQEAEQMKMAANRSNKFVDENGIDANRAAMELKRIFGITIEQARFLILESIRTGIPPYKVLEEFFPTKYYAVYPKDEPENENNNVDIDKLREEIAEKLAPENTQEDHFLEERLDDIKNLGTGNEFKDDDIDHLAR